MCAIKCAKPHCDFREWALSSVMDTPKPRALTYTEMMNGGRQQIDLEAHQQELDIARRTEALEEAVAHLEESLDQEN